MYRRTSRISRSNRMRWARETTLAKSDAQVTAGSTRNFIVVPSVAGQGNRKVRQIVLKISSSFDYPMPIALVFVPSGTMTSEIGSGTVGGITASQTPGQAPVQGDISSFYEPNQNVLAVGQIPCSLNEVTTLTFSGTRTLGSGDCVACVFKNLSDTAITGELMVTATYLVGY